MSDIKHPTIYKDEDIELFLETHPYWKLLIHCYVAKWNRTNYFKFIHLWLELSEQLKNKGFEYIYAAVLRSDEKLKKFAEMFGFKTTGTFLKDNEKNEREVFKCSL